jgi:hypothetical protein
VAGDGSCVEGVAAVACASASGVVWVGVQGGVGGHGPSGGCLLCCGGWRVGFLVVGPGYQACSGRGLL